MAGYINLVGKFIYKQPLVLSLFDGLGENDQFLKDNGWATGTKAIFFQASPPTGWTQDVSQNNRGLRVTSGVGGLAGGSHLISSVIPLAHTAHSIANSPNHTHTITAHYHRLLAAASNRSSGGSSTQYIMDDGGFIRYFLQFSGQPSKSYLMNYLEQTGGTITTGSAGAHNHTGFTQTARLTDVSLAYVDVIIASKDSSSGYLDYSNFFNHDDQIKYQPFAGVNGLAGNDNFNKDRLTPFGTISVFSNTNAPTGWTKLLTQNNKLLRVVSGAGGGQGGSFAFGTSISLVHSHTTAGFTEVAHTIPAHTHRLAVGGTTQGFDPGIDGDQYFYKGSGNLIRNVSISGPTASRTVVKRTTPTGGSGSTNPDSTSHGHSVGNSLADVTLNYIDVIQCQKNPAGHFYPFVDLTGTIAFKKLVSKQKLDAFAKNDEYLKFHTIEAGTLAYFYQANAPLTWVKIVAQNDRGLRVVTGGGGTFGGNQGFGQPIILAHTHSLYTYQHGHDVGSHVHALDEGATDTNALTGINGISDLGFPNTVPLQLVSNTGGDTTLKTDSGGTVGNFTSAVTHDHGAVTGSLLSNVTLAYADVVYCQKS